MQLNCGTKFSKVRIEAAASLSSLPWASDNAHTAVTSLPCLRKRMRVHFLGFSTT